MPLALAACYQRKQVIEIEGATMGTTYKVVAVDHDNKLDESAVKIAINGALDQVNKSMSNWDDSSEISRLNANGTGIAADMSQELTQVMQAAVDVNTASEGRFDTTIGPLIELWGFGATGAQAMPSEDQIELARAKSGHANTMRLGAGQLEKTRADAQIYLAGIGKGYGADHVGRALKGVGGSDYMGEIGGDLYASGRNPDGLPWQIGIEAPNTTDRGILGVVGVSGMGLASSGDYRNYFEQDGQRFSHLIDPATGRPVAHKTASATVLADNAMLADAWSTAMLILGREKGLEVAAKHGIAVHFIERDPNVAQLQFKSYSSDAFTALTA
jgi:thiamine biosynthesis lipoprotein